MDERPKPSRKRATSLDRLSHLVRTGKLYEVEKWIEKGRRVFFPRSDEKSVLEIAARTGFHSMVELLLRQWDDQESLSAALLEAAYSGHTEVVRLLLRNGADIDKVSLCWAVEKGSSAMLDLLLAKRIHTSADDGLADLVIRPRAPEQEEILRRRRKRVPGYRAQLAKALKHAVRKEDATGVRRALRLGADPRLKVAGFKTFEDRFRGCRWSAMYDAFFTGNVQIIRLLKPNPARDDLARLVSWVTYTDDVGLADFLIGLGYDINDKPNGGSSLLDKCFEHRDCFDRLARRGVVFRARERRAVEQLVERGARLIQTERYAYRAIREALRACPREDALATLRVLMPAAGQDVIKRIIYTPKVQDHLGFTPMRLIRLLRAPESIIL